MDAKTALHDLQQLVNDIRSILRRATAGELSRTDAVRRVDAALGPPVRTDPVKAGSRLTPAVRAYEELVNGCRLALDRLRAGIIGEDAAIEALNGLVCGTPYEETQTEVHDMTLQPETAFPASYGAARKRPMA